PRGAGGSVGKVRFGFLCPASADAGVFLRVRRTLARRGGRATAVAALAAINTVSGNSEKHDLDLDARTAPRTVLLHAAQSRARGTDGPAVPPEQNRRRLVSQSGARSDFRWDSLRARSRRLDRSDDPQYRLSPGAGFQAARRDDPAHGAL